MRSFPISSYIITYRPSRTTAGRKWKTLGHGGEQNHLNSKNRSSPSRIELTNTNVQQLFVIHMGSWWFTGLLFQPSRHCVFTANHWARQLFKSIWQVNDTKLDLVVPQWQLFQLMSGQGGIGIVCQLHKASECFYPDMFPSMPSHHHQLLRIFLQMSHWTLVSSAFSL